MLGSSGWLESKNPLEWTTIDGRQLESIVELAIIDQSAALGLAGPVVVELELDLAVLEDERGFERAPGFGLEALEDACLAALQQGGRSLGTDGLASNLLPDGEFAAGLPGGAAEGLGALNDRRSAGRAGANRLCGLRSTIRAFTRSLCAVAGGTSRAGTLAAGTILVCDDHGNLLQDARADRA